MGTGNGSSVQDRKKSGGRKGGGGRMHKGVQAVRPESVAGGERFEVLWNLECPVGLIQKRNLVQFGQSVSLGCPYIYPLSKEVYQLFFQSIKN